MVQLIRTLWDTAVDNNLNLVRFFAFAVSPEYALQPSPGQYSEAIFKGLDYALEQLRMRGLKVRTAARITLLHDSICGLFKCCNSGVIWCLIAAELSPAVYNLHHCADMQPGRTESRRSGI